MRHLMRQKEYRFNLKKVSQGASIETPVALQGASIETPYGATFVKRCVAVVALQGVSLMRLVAPIRVDEILLMTRLEAVFFLKHLEKNLIDLTYLEIHIIN